MGMKENTQVVINPPGKCVLMIEPKPSELTQEMSRPR